MRPDGQPDDEDAPPEFPRGHQATFVRGVVYGFRLGREYGFGEGVEAMHRAIRLVFRTRKRDDGRTSDSDDD
jgi:hypothetical protein